MIEHRLTHAARGLAAVLDPALAEEGGERRQVGQAERGQR